MSPGAIDSADPREAAIAWAVRLGSGRAGEEDHAAFRDWIERSVRHEAEWKRLSGVMKAFDIVGRRQSRPHGLADRALHAGRTRRDVVRGFVGTGLVGAAGASILNRFVPLAELTADHLTRTAQVRSIPLGGGASMVLGPRTGVDVERMASAGAVSLVEGEIVLEAGAEAWSLQLPGMTLRASRGTFVGRRREGASSIFAADRPGVVACAGSLITVEPGRLLSLDGDRFRLREASARVQAGWVHGELYADDESLAVVAERLRPYFVGVIRVDPAVARLSMTGVLPTGDLDLAFDAIARALDVQVRRVTPFWVTIGRRAAGA